MEMMRRTGLLGENIAACYLQLRGYRVLERNYRDGSLEIDLIAGCRGCLAFIEVKTRRSNKFGEALDSIGKYKLTNIRRAARGYVSAQDFNGAFEEIRFDLIAIDLDVSEDTLKLTHIKGVS